MENRSCSVEKENSIAPATAVSVQKTDVGTTFGWLDVAEATSWLASATIFGMFYYNNVGEIAAWRGVDYAGAIATRFDSMIPTVPIFIVPYVMVYLSPVAFLAAAVHRHRDLRMGMVRRFFVTSLVQMLAAYSLYVAFPVSIDAIAIPPGDSVGPTFWDRLNHTFVHAGMSKFCAFPSLHVALTAQVAWSFRANKLPGTTLAVMFAIATLASTLLTRAHFVADLAGGAALAAAVGFGVLEPLERGRYFETKTGRQGKEYRLASHHRLALVMLAPAILLAGGMALCEATGFVTDPLKMLALR